MVYSWCLAETFLRKKNRSRKSRDTVPLTKQNPPPMSEKKNEKQKESASSDLTSRSGTRWKETIPTAMVYDTT